MMRGTTNLSGDPGYHKRHAKRSLKRAERIACHIKESRNFLDVGCNEGLISHYLLRSGKARRTTGIELSDASLLEGLKHEPTFSLIRGNIRDMPLDESYDCIFYGAVHHHIVREEGFQPSLSVFRKLAQSCSGKIFFETGQLTEGGRWQWQRKLAYYFSNDEEHIFHILRSIEPMLSGFKVIGRFPIHGVRRQLMEITITHEDLSPPDFDFTLPEDCELKTFKRAPGTRLQEVTQSNSDDHAHGSFTGPIFCKATSGEKIFFLKKRTNMPHMDAWEYQIGRSVHFAWAVSPIGLSSSGIVFPWINGTALAECARTSKHERSSYKQQLDQIMIDAESHISELPNSLLISSSKLRLIDIVDFNINNFIVSNGTLLVIDFEYFSSSTLYRNYVNFSRIYWSLGARGKAVKLGGLGFFGIFLNSARASFWPFEVRALRRTPSLVSWLVSWGRGLLGRTAVKVAPFLSEK